MIIFLFANILSQRYEMNFNFKYFYTMGFLEMSLFLKHYVSKAKFSRKHINMITAVVSFCLSAANIAVTSSITMLLTFVNRLKDNLTAINNLQQVSVNPITGYASQKAAARVTCTEISVRIMKACFSYAIEVANDVLRNQMDTTRSKLKNMSDTDFEAFTRNAYNNALPFRSQLEAYGVETEEFDLWIESCDTFKDLIANPSIQRSNKNQSKREIQQILRSSMLLLNNQIDELVLQLQESHPAYFGEYFLNRKLHPLTKHTKFRIRVTNELGEPIYDVRVQQDNSDRMAATDIMGEATVMVQVERNPDTQPVYSFTITNGSQTIQTGNIEIKLGHTVTRHYEMQPTGFILPEPVSETVTETA